MEKCNQHEGTVSFQVHGLHKLCFLIAASAFLIDGLMMKSRTDFWPRRDNKEVILRVHTRFFREMQRKCAWHFLGRGYVGSEWAHTGCQQANLGVVWFCVEVALSWCELSSPCISKQHIFVLSNFLCTQPLLSYSLLTYNLYLTNHTNSTYVSQVTIYSIYTQHILCILLISYMLTFKQFTV